MAQTKSYPQFHKETTDLIKKLGVEEVLIRVAWNVTILLNRENELK